MHFCSNVLYNFKYHFLNKYHLNFIKLAIFLLITWHINTHPQSTQNQLELLLINKPIEMFEQNVSPEDIIAWNEQMLKKVKKHNYTKGEIWVYMNIAKECYRLSKPDLSLKYLNIAKEKADKISADNQTYIKLYNEFSIVYFTLDLIDLSLKYSTKSEKYALNIANIDSRSMHLSNIYNIRSISLSEKNIDSALYYKHKSLKIHRNPRKISDLAFFYLKDNINIDSAKFYLNEAEILFNKNETNNKYNLSVFYFYKAKLNIIENNNHLAVENLEKSLELAKGTFYRKHLLGVYNLLADTYEKNGDFDKQSKILHEYQKFTKSYDKSKAKSLELTIKNIEKETNRQKNYWLYGVSVFIIFASGVILLYFKYERKKLKNQEQHNTSQSQKIEKIKDVFKNSIDELYESATSRDPNFYSKFQLVYPNFQSELLKLSNLQNSELLLLAYIYLNIETKHIADILYKSPKTIQNRKHLIRKKLNIASNVDLNVWLKENIE